MAFLAEILLRLVPIGPNWHSIGPEQALSAPNGPGRVPASGQFGELRVRRGIGDLAQQLAADRAGEGIGGVHHDHEGPRPADDMVGIEPVDIGGARPADLAHTIRSHHKDVDRDDRVNPLVQGRRHVAPGIFPPRAITYVDGPPSADTVPVRMLAVDCAYSTYLSSL